MAVESGRVPVEVTAEMQQKATSPAPGSISGTVWNDADGNGLVDSGESGMAGVTVYLDANENSVFDAGERFVTTATDDGGTPEDETGMYLFDNVAPGDYVVREVVPAGFDLTFPNAPPPADYQIDLIFPDSSLTASQQAIFSSAAERWAEIITGDVPDIFGLRGFGDVDDLVIEATAPYIDGVGKILGAAWPSHIRLGSNIPIAGSMSFDSADIAALEASGQLYDVILHEMGHVIGIGTTWAINGLLTGAGGDDPRFIGAQATSAYNTIFGNTESSVPVANTRGVGTRDAHWRESIFDTELMTGFLDVGVANPISEVTIGSLADSGYTVDYDAADPYVPSESAAAAYSSVRVGGWFELKTEGFTYIDASPTAILAGIAVEQEDFWKVDVLAGENVTGVDFGNQQSNQPPTIALMNVTTSVPEDTDTSSRVKVADIVVTDDGVGTNVLSLTGADAALFEISGDELFLASGATLDFETNPELSATVEVDDDAVGSTPDDRTDLTIDVEDIDEQLSSIGDLIWFDENEDGFQNRDERGVRVPKGITVRLFEAGKDGMVGGRNDSFVADTRTNKWGLYFFELLNPGSYYVEFVLPEGFAFTRQNLDIDWKKDSDANPITGLTTPFNLATHKTDRSRDAGLVIVPASRFDGVPVKSHGNRTVPVSVVEGDQTGRHITQTWPTQPADAIDESPGTPLNRLDEKDETVRRGLEELMMFDKDFKLDI